jgi:hypothetical protein
VPVVLARNVAAKAAPTATADVSPRQLVGATSAVRPDSNGVATCSLSVPSGLAPRRTACPQTSTVHAACDLTVLMMSNRNLAESTVVTTEQSFIKLLTNMVINPY